MLLFCSKAGDSTAHLMLFTIWSITVSDDIHTYTSHIKDKQSYLFVNNTNINQSNKLFSAVLKIHVYSYIILLIIHQQNSVSLR